LLQATETEKKYAITWASKKEQCLALGPQLWTLFKINDYKIDRIFPNRDVWYLYTRDGRFLEKMNARRIDIGNLDHSMGKNVQPISVKFTSKRTFD
tara:strand:- start:167 stop:454 length:288 start_codon:yes stop_codon:yes gene_type:complete